MKWNVSYYSSSVEEQLLDWPKKILAKYLFITRLMIDHGPNLGEPYTKAFGKGLYEIRAKGQEGIGRVFFCTTVGHEIVILHQFIKKTQKTPANELEIAYKRLKEVKK